ncbi:MAG: hypothetical protein JWP45_3583 [Mucilaginibacter sp.]|nr:hypothetical protein [Mucilaginibacter sp.]
MNRGIFIKIMIFIILALFASWPYFENFKRYSITKKAAIGVSILSLLILGIMDIINSDTQLKNDKHEIVNLTNTVSILSSTIVTLNVELKGMDKRQYDVAKIQDGRFNELKNQLTLSIQEMKGNISKSLKDTSNK